MGTDDLKKITDLLEKFIEPLVSATASQEAAKELILELGYIPPPQFAFFGQLGSCIQGIQQIVADVNALWDTDTAPDNDVVQEIITNLSTLVPQLIDFVNSLDQNIQSEFGGQDFTTQTDILTQLPERLFNFLLIRYLEQDMSTAFSVLQLFQVINSRQIESPDHPLKHPFILYEFDWSKISDLFSDPKGLLLAALRNATGYFFYNLIYKLQEFGQSLGLSSHFKYPNLDVLELINNNPNIAEWPGLKNLEILRIPFAPSYNPEMGVDIYPLIDTTTDTFSGLVLGIGLDTELSIDISEKLNLSFNLSANLANGLGFTIDKDDNFRFIADLFTNPQSIPEDLIIGLVAKLRSINTSESEPLFRLGTPDGSYFQLGSFELAFGIEKSSDIHLYAETDFRDGEIAIDFGSADGFISNAAGDGIKSNFDLGLGFSNLRGLYFKGSSSLEISLPTHIQLGPIDIQGLTVELIFQNEKLPVSISSTIAVKLGPLQAVVEEIGIKADFKIVGDKSGNLGPLDLSLGFKPPNGLGLSLDAGAVKGGGYLYFDFDREEYAGALELVFSEWIALKAIGVITTKMPDGSKGFSMVIIITAEFGSGLQLGLGFTLLGVGGIIGINRVVNVEPLKDGVRTGAIESVLFPQDVVANAPRIISDLKAFFPVREGQFLIGPMAKIGYGTPTLASLSLGLIIEFPDVNITILGVLKIVLPDENADVLRLQVNFLGRIEPANSLLWFYAELYDSRVLFITLEGGMGLLVNWGNNSNFVFSVGGFHPQFTPPPLPFPAPPRLAVNILNETYARVRIEGYFAVTSNSVQFGARVEVFFGVSAFNIDGHFGFDALFQFDPFYFSFSLSVSLSVKLFGMGVFSIGFSGLLEGPTPWHIKGQGSIGFLFFSVSVPFEETWGEQPATPLPPIEIFPLIEREFNAITNWQAVVPTGSRLFVSLRKLDEPTESAPQTSQETDKRPLVLHPVGSLRISQRKMPLDFKMDKLGNQMPADVNEISIAAAISGADAVNPGVAKEKFARGEYQNLDQAKKLSEPAFELYNGGLELKADGAQLKTSMAVKRIIRYETIIIDSNFKRHAHKFFEAIVTSFSLLAGRLFGHFVKGSVITKSTVSAAYQQRIQPNEQVITVELPKYSVALMMDNSPLAGTDGLTTASFASKAEAFNFMQSQITGDPRKAGTLHIIPNTELNQSTAA